jgi:hypothetical protein
MRSGAASTGASPPDAVYRSECGTKGLRIQTSLLPEAQGRAIHSKGGTHGKPTARVFATPRRR